MPTKFTIVFPDDVEHRYSEKVPKLGETIEARQTVWAVAEVKDARLIVRPLRPAQLQVRSA